MKSSETTRKIPSEYALLLGAAALALVLDVESTKYSHRDADAVEFNSWIYGERPSRTRMYAVNVPRTIALAAVAAYLKRKYPTDAKNHWAWRIPFWGLLAGHGVAALANFVNFSPRKMEENQPVG